MLSEIYTKCKTNLKMAEKIKKTNKLDMSNYKC